MERFEQRESAKKARRHNMLRQDAADALMELSVLEEADSDNDSSNPEETTILIGPSDPADNEENPKDDNTPAPEPDLNLEIISLWQENMYLKEELLKMQLTPEALKKC